MAIRDDIIEKMLELGHEEVKSSSKKYRQFAKNGAPGQFYWVGKMGGVRYGKTISSSISITDYWYKKVRPGHV